MKQEFDKEIDSLLRRSARVAAAGPASAEGARAQLASSHLDADELSAFAENALPASARLAAASHLADCDECRGVVVRLSSAADVAGEIEKRAAASPTVAAAPVEVPWWKSLLATLFAPRVLRYAAPALVLGLVGVVSFIALRPNRGSVPVTVLQNEEARDAGAAPAPQGSGDTATVGTNPNPDADANANVTATAPSSAGTSGPGTATTTAKPDEQPVAGLPAAPVVAASDDAPPVMPTEIAPAKKAGTVGEAATSPQNAELSAANTVAPAPPPAPKSAGTEVVEQPKGARGADLSRSREPEEANTYNDRVQQEQNRAAQSRSRQQEMQTPDGGGARNDSRAMNNRGNVGGAYPPAATRAERPASRRGRVEESKARDSAAEEDEAVRVDSTRSVAGRRFRREGSAWVDVNYKPSMSMTAVRRGTEGYRALVADIPELGRIAEQLGGEVITVVKGRAYRIR